jgi:hypothetical protein
LGAAFCIGQLVRLYPSRPACFRHKPPNERRFLAIQTDASEFRMKQRRRRLRWGSRLPRLGCSVDWRSNPMNCMYRMNQMNHMNHMYRTLLATVALAFSSVAASADTITVCASG